MNKTPPLFHFALALLASGAAIASAAQQTTAHDFRSRADAPRDTGPGSVSVPRLAYRQRTLSNGLNVFSIENHNSPNVAIQVWYKVGGKNDPANKSGFAHLFEHLMFKSTRNMKSEMMDQLTEYVGGENNAYTTEDRTVYHETVPSNYLETLLWAEADRMANLNVDEPDFISERAVVEEEYRQSVLAPPYGRLYEFANEHSFALHPYRRGVIGSIADLDAADIDDVRRFHNTYYRPDNAVLIVTGDFDPSKLDGWIDKYFGRIPKAAGDIPRITEREPPRTEEKRYSETGPNVPLPAVVINYLVPPAASTDAAPLSVAGVILSRGESSRLYQSLIYKQHVASSANARADLRADAGLFQFTIVAAGGKAIDLAEHATLAEVARLQAEPVTRAELDKARNQLLADALRRRETANGQAALLGDAVVTLGDPDRINTDIARLQAVTADDVQRVAKQYFTPDNRVVVRYSSGSQQQGGVSHTASAPVSAPPVSPAAAVETPPLPAATRRTLISTPVDKTLPNGLRVVVVPRSGTGLVSVVVAIRAGGSADPENAAGLADFTASLLTRGTTTRSATQIAEAVEALGGSISSGASWDSSTVTLSVMSARLEDAIPGFADVVLNPAFSPVEVARLKTESLDSLAVSLRSPGALAQYTTARVVFGDSAYGHALNGTPESIAAIRPSDVSAFYHDHYLPQRAAVVFGGDISPDAAFTLAERYFGAWKGSKAAFAPASPGVAPSPSGRVVVVDKPDAGQAAVVLASSGIRRADPSYSVGRVANGVFGEGYSSRINQEIRIKRGLSYGASSRIDARQNGGLFTAAAQTRNNAVPEVALLLKQELARMITEAVPTGEMAARKAALSGNYTRRLETGSGLTSAAADLAIYNLPLSTLSGFPRTVQSVTTSQVRAFAAQRLNPEQSSIIIVGDARQFLPELRKKFANIEVIPISQLDLNHGSLRKL